MPFFCVYTKFEIEPCKELWSGEIIRDETWDWIDVQLSGEDSKIYKFTKVRDF